MATDPTTGSSATTKNLNARIKNKRDTSANWTTNNPVLLDGEIIVVDTNAGDVRFKVGDGSSSYSQLPFIDEAIISSIPTKTSDLTNDSGFITAAGAPVQSVNTKTGAVELAASDVGAVAKTGDTMTGNLTVGSASLQTNGYVTGTWLKTTADVHLGSAATNFAVLSGGWIYSRTASEVLSDIGAAPAASGVPTGAIMMWSGASTAIPDGWVLCDGTNSTPDLRNRFVIGAGSTYAVGATGGSTARSIIGNVTAGPQVTVSTSALPPYYALCYIMKT